MNTFILKRNSFLNIVWFVFLSLITYSPLNAETLGKIELAPAYAHLDVLEFGKTVKKLDLFGIRGEAAFQVWKGIYLRATALQVPGTQSSSLFTGSIGIGQYSPITEKLCVVATVGCSYTNLRTILNHPSFQLFHIRERFRSIGPYACIELNYSFTKSFRGCVAIQYSWNRTITTLHKILTQKGNSNGPAYGLSLEKDFDAHWSINMGFVYNLSLDREKHGIRALGTKVGIVRWF